MKKINVPSVEDPNGFSPEAATNGNRPSSQEIVSVNRSVTAAVHRTIRFSQQRPNGYPPLPVWRAETTAQKWRRILKIQLAE